MPPRPAPAPPVTPPEVTETLVLAKCDYFLQAQLWPIHSDLDPRAWLANFEPPELDHAVHLLNAFLFFSEALVDQLFTAGFQSLSRSFATGNPEYATSVDGWNTFLDRVLVTHVTGETPNVTDSGLVFARKARQLWGIPEARIMSPDQALAEISTDGVRPVVFVDDFVGTGEQFIETWRREYAIEGQTSYESLSTTPEAEFYYCPVVATVAGAEAIAAACPTVRLSPAHLLPARYSAIDPESLIWPPHLISSARDFIDGASDRAGVSASERYGYQALALALAFKHSVPDATLPLFYASNPDWHPLLVRS
jgi:hypothetical protein